MRGIVTLAAALALPHTTAAGAPFPFREEIILFSFDGRHGQAALPALAAAGCSACSLASRQTCKEAVFEGGDGSERCYGGRRHGNAAGSSPLLSTRSCGHSPREYLSPHLPARACAHRLRRSPPAREEPTTSHRLPSRSRARLASVLRFPSPSQSSLVVGTRPSVSGRSRLRSGTSASRTAGAVVSPSGFDCSGLVTYVFGQLGVSVAAQCSCSVRPGPGRWLWANLRPRRPRLLPRARSRGPLRRRAAGSSTRRSRARASRFRASPRAVARSSARRRLVRS